MPGPAAPPAHPNGATLYCPYCGFDKPEDEFTDEHVLPRGIGGNLEPSNPFKFDVCRPCNGFCGDYVDGRALRGFLGMLARAELVKPIGRLDGWSSEDGTICDYWLGPAGNQVFHFHRPYPWGDVMIRGAPWAKRKKKKLDPGVLLIVVRPTNPAWFPIIVEHTRDTFPGAEAYTLNAPPGVPAKYARHVAWIESLPPPPAEVKCHTTIDPHAGEPFTAKLALGLGSIYLGEEFQRSADAAALRDFMRGEKVDLRGLPPFSPGRDRGQMVEAFAWRDCHTIFLQPMGWSLSLTAVLYGQHPLTVPITEDPGLWQGKIRDGGLAWVVAPRLRRFGGPSSVPEMLIDMQRATPTGPLADLHERLQAQPPFPPVHLEPE